VALLAGRRAKDHNGSGITVNFPGFADIFRHQNPLPASQAPVHAADPINSPHRRIPPPPMKLDDFCQHYDLSDAINAKLVDIQIAGLHVLRLIADCDLREEGKLSIGELASVRDAQQRWSHDLNHQV
jgi:hypothetical protein